MAALLVAGAIALFEVMADGGTQPVASIPRPAPVSNPLEDKPLQKGGRLEGEARRVVQSFVFATLGRTNLHKAWELATRSLRDAVTKEQWLAGSLPIPPYPVDRLLTSGYDVLESSPTKMLLQVFLVPEKSTGVAPLRFDLTIVRPSPSERWKVSYFVPYDPPGIPSVGD